MPQKPSPSQYPALTGNFVVDAPRGGVRVRRWPKKRGKPKSEAQAKQVEWFRQASWFMKYLPAEFIQQAELLSHGTPLLTRDILMMAMAGRLYSFNLPGGKRWHPMAFITDVSKSLDALSDTPGSMFFRGPELWTPIAPPALPSVLQFDPVTNAPMWSTGSVGGAPYSARCTSPASYSSGTVSWNAPDFDDGGFWDAGDPSKFTIPAGVTWDRANVHFQCSNNGSPQIIIRKNGSNVMIQEGPSTGGSDYQQGATGVIDVAPGDVFQAYSNLSLTGGLYVFTIEAWTAPAGTP